MKITRASHTKDRITSLQIEFEEGEDGTAVEAALLGHKWVRQNHDGELEVSEAAVPPKLSDPEIDNHFTSDQVVLRLAPTKEPYEPAFYVQHICGYGGHNYQERAGALRMRGFSCLRSKRGVDGRFWEVWYLSGRWAAEYDLRGKSTEEIKNWLLSFGSGQFSIEGESWGLGID